MDMIHNLQDIGSLLLIACVAMLLVFLAMGLDLISGLRKAKQRNEVRTSKALKRTINKFCTYEGSMMIATFIDVLLHLCNFWETIHLTSFSGVPLITCFVGIFHCCVEFKSIRENADQKVKNNMSETASIINQMLQSDTAKEALTATLVKAAENTVDKMTESKSDEEMEE